MVQQKRKRTEETGTKTPSYAKTVKKQLRTKCIMLRSIPTTSGNLHKDHLKVLEEMVNNKILNHIMVGGDPIPIMSSGMKNNKMFLKVAARANSSALKVIIEKIKLPWKNGSLKLVKWNEIPRHCQPAVWHLGIRKVINRVWYTGPVWSGMLRTLSGVVNCARNSSRIR